MQNTYKDGQIEYVNHIFNSSPSKAAYSFTKQSRFKTDTSPEQSNSFNNISKTSFNESNINKEQIFDLTQMGKGKPQERVKRDRFQQQKDKYFGYESRSKKKIEQYSIFPVRKSINEILREMQELRCVFKTGFRQKKFMNSQKEEGQNQKKIHTMHSPRSITPERSKSVFQTDRAAIRKSNLKQQTRSPNQKLYNSDVKDREGNRRRSVSPFSNYAQSTFRNSTTFSFTTSPRNLQDGRNTQTVRKFDFYSPFSEFGPVKQRVSQAY